MKCKNFLIGILVSILLLVGGFNLRTTAQFYGGDKPLFVEISTTWCFACQLLKPTIEELKSQYLGQVEFVFLDASNEESIQQAEQIASDYGISDFFNKNRGAFPTVGILSPDGKVQKIVLGAAGKETYTTVLDNLLGETTTIADNDNDKPKPEEPQEEEIASGDNRPEEPELSNRPEEAIFLERPNELVSSGRPPELTFWTAGQPIPIYAYYNFLVFPKCSGSNNVVCANNSGFGAQQAESNSDKPIFKPWDPNATRNEKGFDEISKG